MRRAGRCVYSAKPNDPPGKPAGLGEVGRLGRQRETDFRLTDGYANVQRQILAKDDD